MEERAAKVAGWVLYLLCVVGLVGAILALSGRPSEMSQMTLVASTLIAAALLHPLRVNLQDYLEGRLRERRALRAARESRRR